MLFNEKGFLDIDVMISQEPSFQNIMADGIVTSDELIKQTEVVEKLLAETNVLTAIYRYYELQNFG